MSAHISRTYAAHVASYPVIIWMWIYKYTLSHALIYYCSIRISDTCCSYAELLSCSLLFLPVGFGSMWSWKFGPVHVLMQCACPRLGWLSWWSWWTLLWWGHSFNPQGPNKTHCTPCTTAAKWKHQCLFCAECASFFAVYMSFLSVFIYPVHFCVYYVFAFCLLCVMFVCLRGFVPCWTSLVHLLCVVHVVCKFPMLCGCLYFEEFEL